MCSSSLLGNVVLLVAGYNPENGTFERTRSSCQFFSGLELGWSHLAGNGTARFLNNLATQLPEVARYAWGEEAARFANLDQAKAWCDSIKDANSLPAGLEWFTAGWYQIAPRGDVQEVYLRSWAKPHLEDVVSWMSANGLRQRQTFAAGVRARNSGADFTELKSRVAKLGEQNGLSGFLDWWGTQSKTSRANAVRTWQAFKGELGAGELDEAALISTIDFGTAAPVWPSISSPVAVSPGAPLVTQTSGGGSIAGMSKRNLLIIGGAIAAVGAAWAGVYFLLPGKKKRRKGRRR